ncbi:MAG: CocE/NonD family hydrolase [Polaromonas sp.]|nr:CocE/NonD family hydrolase [Polaromonas sp.]MDP3751019.1 CocE/NonD family hydrolase [Polaromonas sp.]
MRPPKLILVAVCLAASLGPVMAQSGDIDASLNETVVQIPKKGLFNIALETTLYRPDGEGPFPVAVINHGKAYGDARFQGRYRPATAARYFLQRGYAVVVPMRQGFSKSGGSYIGGGCNVESNGKVQAEDVKAVLDHVVTQPWADKDRIVVLGQSHGGWTTLAFGPLNYPGVKGLVNFAGGLRQEGCNSWQKALASGAASYAAQTRLPSLWFYGDNDSYFTTDTYQAMFDQYTAAGGQARLVAFGTFGNDAHNMFASRAGQRIWQPEVSRLLASVGLPSEPVGNFAKYAASGLMPVPPRTGFAAIDDESKLPHVRDTGRAAYKTYLTKFVPRAFAIGTDGAWGWADGGEDPLRRAVDNCQRNSKTPCKLYSVDDFIVWP